MMSDAPPSAVSRIVASPRKLATGVKTGAKVVGVGLRRHASKLKRSASSKFSRGDASGSGPPECDPGDQVIIVNMKSAPSLNSCVGVVKKYDEYGDTYDVHVIDEDATFKIHPSNARRIVPEPWDKVKILNDQRHFLNNQIAEIDSGDGNSFHVTLENGGRQYTVNASNILIVQKLNPETLQSFQKRKRTFKTAAKIISAFRVKRFRKPRRKKRGIWSEDETNADQAANEQTNDMNGQNNQQQIAEDDFEEMSDSDEGEYQSEIQYSDIPIVNERSRYSGEFTDFVVQSLNESLNNVNALTADQLSLRDVSSIDDVLRKLGLVHHTATVKQAGITLESIHEVTDTDLEAIKFKIGERAKFMGVAQRYKDARVQGKGSVHVGYVNTLTSAKSGDSKMTSGEGSDSDSSSGSDSSDSDSSDTEDEGEVRNGTSAKSDTSAKKTDSEGKERVQSADKDNQSASKGGDSGHGTDSDSDDSDIAAKSSKATEDNSDGSDSDSSDSEDEKEKDGAAKKKDADSSDSDSSDSEDEKEKKVAATKKDADSSDSDSSDSEDEKEKEVAAKKKDADSSDSDSSDSEDEKEKEVAAKKKDADSSDSEDEKEEEVAAKKKDADSSDSDSSDSEDEKEKEVAAKKKDADSSDSDSSDSEDEKEKKVAAKKKDADSSGSDSSDSEDEKEKEVAAKKKDADSSDSDSSDSSDSEDEKETNAKKAKATGDSDNSDDEEEDKTAKSEDDSSSDSDSDSDTDKSEAEQIDEEIRDRAFSYKSEWSCGESDGEEAARERHLDEAKRKSFVSELQKFDPSRLRSSPKAAPSGTPPKPGYLDELKAHRAGLKPVSSDEESVRDSDEYSSDDDSDHEDTRPRKLAPDADDGESDGDSDVTDGESDLRDTQAPGLIPQNASLLQQIAGGQAKAALVTKQAREAEEDRRQREEAALEERVKSLFAAEKEKARQQAQSFLNQERSRRSLNRWASSEGPGALGAKVAEGRTEETGRDPGARRPSPASMDTKAFFQKEKERIAALRKAQRLSTGSIGPSPTAADAFRSAFASPSPLSGAAMGAAAADPERVPAISPKVPSVEPKAHSGQESSDVVQESPKAHSAQESSREDNAGTVQESSQVPPALESPDSFQQVHTADQVANALSNSEDESDSSSTSGSDEEADGDELAQAEKADANVAGGENQGESDGSQGSNEAEESGESSESERESENDDKSDNDDASSVDEIEVPDGESSEEELEEIASSEDEGGVDDAYNSGSEAGGKGKYLDSLQNDHSTTLEGTDSDSSQEVKLNTSDLNLSASPEAEPSPNAAEVEAGVPHLRDSFPNLKIDVSSPTSDGEVSEIPLLSSTSSKKPAMALAAMDFLQ